MPFRLHLLRKNSNVSTVTLETSQERSLQASALDARLCIKGLWYKQTSVPWFDLSLCYVLISLRSYGRAPKMIHLEANFVQFKEELLPKEGNKALLTFPFLHIYWTDCCVSLSLRQTLESFRSFLRNRDRASHDLLKSWFGTFMLKLTCSPCASVSPPPLQIAPWYDWKGECVCAHVKDWLIFLKNPVREMYWNKWLNNT